MLGSYESIWADKGDRKARKSISTNSKHEAQISQSYQKITKTAPNDTGATPISVFLLFRTTFCLSFKGVTCNGFWGFEGRREKVSHITASGVLRGEGKRCHM